MLISPEKINVLLPVLPEETLVLLSFSCPSTFGLLFIYYPDSGFSVIVINFKETGTISNPLYSAVGRPAFKALPPMDFIRVPPT